MAGRTPFSEDDAIEPIVTDDTTPQSVVEIEDQHLPLCGPGAGDQVCQLLRDVDEHRSLAAGARDVECRLHHARQLLDVLDEP